MNTHGSLRVLLLLIGVQTLYAFTIGGLHVDGNQIKDENGDVVQLRGVDHSGTEFACIQGYGIFDGPHDLASVLAMKTWNVNIVRLPLNEDCWLQINGVKPQYSGTIYQSAIMEYVDLLNQNGIAVILDLHWTAPGSNPAIGQLPMPDMDHSVDFWTEVANEYKNNSAVIFDLFNEPFPDDNQDTTAGWECWRDGGSNCPGCNYTVAGMQTLVDAVRATGSQNIVMLGGLQYSNCLTNWLEYQPTDPTGNTAASWHSYNFNYCNFEPCWNAYIAPVAAKVPLIAGEIGENDCTSNYIDPLMTWLDGEGAHYLGWTWNTWDCDNGPALISNYTGLPTEFGLGLKLHLTNEMK